MICPDCEMDTSKFVKSRGICVACYKRLMNAKSRKLPYIPVKDIKGTHEYNRVMSRRLSTKHKNCTKVNKSTYDENTNETLKSKYYSKVTVDIKNAFNEEGISESYLQYKDLDKWFEVFYLLMQDSNFITEAKSGEVIFNKLFQLYKHTQESLDWEKVEQINDISYAQKALSELRRPTKEILDFYVALDPIITYLKKDSNFMELLNTARINMANKIDNHRNSIYYTEVDSSMIDNDSIVKTSSNKTKLFDCTVWCYNLNGNPNRKLFRMNNGIYAQNETYAKLKFKEFLNSKFPNVTYKDIDICIEEVNSVEEITNKANNQKECL